MIAKALELLAGRARRAREWAKHYDDQAQDSLDFMIGLQKDAANHRKEAEQYEEAIAILERSQLPFSAVFMHDNKDHGSFTSNGSTIAHIAAGPAGASTGYAINR